VALKGTFVTPKDAGCIARRRSSRDAEACTGVVPRHGRKVGAGRYAEYADCTLAPDAVAAGATHGEVTPDDTRRIAGGRFSNDAEACAAVIPKHGGRTVRGRYAPYADCTLA
jgi:hypothetical protein